MSRRGDVWPPQCRFCCKFIGYADMEAGQTVSWTPYGGPLDLEPPDDRWAHRRCWAAATDEDRRLINRIAWQADAEVRRA